MRDMRVSSTIIPKIKVCLNKYKSIYLLRRCRPMNLEQRRQTSMRIIWLRRFRMEHLDRMGSTGQIDNLAFIKVRREVIDVHCGRHHNHLQCGQLSFAACSLGLLDDAEQDVRVDGALVRFVQHDYAVPFEQAIGEGFTEQGAIGQVTDFRSRSGHVLEANGVTNLGEIGFYKICLGFSSDH